MQASATEIAPGQEPSRSRIVQERKGAWIELLTLQAIVAVLLFFPFMSGKLYFAYLDIAADSYVVTALNMHLAHVFGREGFTGWSFGMGLGAPLAFAYNDIVGQLTRLAGAAHVLELRIWVYLLKLAMGGFFFLCFAQGLVRRKEAAVIAALAYSFCGYIITNGVWDSETNIWIFAPLVLWGLQRYLSQGDVLTLPLAVGAMLLSGVFFVMVGVSLLVTFAVCIAVAAAPRATARKWTRGVVPLIAVGFVIGAPYVLPIAFQLLDSPRVGDPGSLLSRISSQIFQLSDRELLLDQIGGFFHKDIFGVGSLHRSYMNYLESPGFYVGVLPLVAIPQLWRAGQPERRMLVVAAVAVALYVLFPAFRLAAFGFSVPYFRGTTLWVALGLLVLGTLAIDTIFTRQVDMPILAISAVSLWTVLGLLWWLAPVSPDHVIKMAIFVAAWTLALGLAKKIGSARLPTVVVLLMLVEVVAVAWPSYFALRTHVSPQEQPYQDESVPALAAIRADHPPSFYRVEKTFDSNGQADALAQDYMGVKSYYYHGRSIVRFHEGMDLMIQYRRRPLNYTNWLPGPGNRYMLQSALGVRYVISKTPLNWPGFQQMAAGQGFVVYRNELAFPLGVVQSAQITTAEMNGLSALPRELARRRKDFALVNAVVLDELLPASGHQLEPDLIKGTGEPDLSKYVNSAVEHQRTGLQISRFSSDYVSGVIQPRTPGILVFSIPAYHGWTLKIDGQTVEMITANFGMLAAPVGAGSHEVELRYRMPGLLPGAVLGLFGLAGLYMLWWRSRRRAKSPSEGEVDTPRN